MTDVFPSPLFHRRRTTPLSRSRSARRDLRSPCLFASSTSADSLSISVFSSPQSLQTRALGLRLSLDLPSDLCPPIPLATHPRPTVRSRRPPSLQARRRPPLQTTQSGMLVWLELLSRSECSVSPSHPSLRASPDDRLSPRLPGRSAFKRHWMNKLIPRKVQGRTCTLCMSVTLSLLFPRVSTSADPALAICVSRRRQCGQPSNDGCD